MDWEFSGPGYWVNKNILARLVYKVLQTLGAVNTWLQTLNLCGNHYFGRTNLLLVDFYLANAPVP